jgi:hypothetical protein
LAVLLVVSPPLGGQRAEAAINPDCTAAFTPNATYLTCHYVTKKVYAPLQNTYWRDSVNHRVYVYSATLYNLSGKHNGQTFVCSKSWGGSCYNT